MHNIKAAARNLAENAGTTFTIRRVKSPRRKMPVTHVRIVFDAVIDHRKALRAFTG